MTKKAQDDLFWQNRDVSIVSVQCIYLLGLRHGLRVGHGYWSVGRIHAFKDTIRVSDVVAISVSELSNFATLPWQKDTGNHCLKLLKTTA